MSDDQLRIVPGYYVVCNFVCSCVTDDATTRLARAINDCDLQRAEKIIEDLDKNLDKSERKFNVQLDYFGDVQTHEEETVKEEEKNQFRYT